MLPTLELKRNVSPHFMLDRRIRFRSGPAFKKILRKLQRIGISLHSVVEKPLLRFGAAELEVVEGKFGMQA